MTTEVIILDAPGEVVGGEEPVEVIDNLEGPMGPPGSGVAAGYTHTQASAATEWIVNHNLGAKPTVSVLSPGGVELIADVVHLSTNQARIYFAAPTAGSARFI